MADTDDSRFLAQRINELDSLLRHCHENGTTTREFLLTTDGVLDAVLALYNECSNDRLQFNKCARGFVDKYKQTVDSIRSLRVSASDFEMKTVIGRGHFGEVRVVRERASGTVYAMKSLRKHETLTQPDIACIEEERDIMAKTTSRWLTRLHYAFQDRHNLYLIMDYHPGGDLLSLLSRYNDVFEEEMAKFYVAEIALAINDLHTMGYIHRDVKPENVLLAIDGHVRLADFGSAAKLSWDRKVHAGMKMPVGTPDYVSPELLHSINSDSHRKYGGEVDWWSLGVCAYEMVYGHTPFTDDSQSIMNTYSNIMNYKEHLKFPENPASAAAVSFIGSLLTDADSRMDYGQISKHVFLTSLDLALIHESTPPFVPSIAGLDDTSNFDEFDTVKSQPAVDDVQPHRGPFSGKDLPFVGFTFTKSTTPLSLGQKISTTSDESDAGVAAASALCTTSAVPGQTSGLEVTLTVKLHELQSVKEKVHELELSECALQSDLECLQQQCKSRDCEMSQIEADRAVIEAELRTYTQRYQQVADDLANEVKERRALDDRTYKIWSDIKDMSMEAHQIEHDLHSTELDRLHEVVVQLEFEKETLGKKLQKREKQLSAVRVELEKSRSQIGDLHRKINKDRRRSVEVQKRDIHLHEEREKVWSKQVDEQNMQISALTEKIQELEDLVSTQKEKETHCCGSKTQEKIMEVVNKLDKRRSDEKAWKIKEQTLHEKIADLEGRLELYRNRGLLSRQPDTHQLQDKIASHQQEVSQQRETIEELKKTIQKYVDSEKDKGDGCVLLEKKVEMLETEIKQLKKEKSDTETKSDQCMKDMDAAKEETRRLDEELEKLKTAENEEMRRDKKKLKDLQNTYKTCQGDLEELEKAKDLLEQELKSRDLKIKQLEQSLEVEKNVVKERLLKDKRVSSEKISATRICDLQQENDFLQSKVKVLEDKLTTQTSDDTESRDSMSKLREDNQKKERQIKALTRELHESSELLEESETKISLLTKREADLSAEVSAARSNIADMERRLTAAEISKKALEAEVQELQRHNNQMEASGDWKDLYATLEKSHQDTVAELSEETREKRRAVMNLESVRGELATKSHQLELEVKKVEKWRLACEELETQNTDLELLVTAFKEQKEQTATENKKLERATEDKLKEIEEATKQLRSEQKTKNVMIEKLNLMKSKLDNTNSLHQQEVEALTYQLTHEQCDMECLNKQMSELEEQKTQQEMLLEAQQKNIALERSETIKVKEEISQYITENHRLRKEKLELSQQLDEAMDKFELIFGEKVSLENVMDKLQGSHFLEKYRFESTIDQQMKLINYLQTKTEGTPKKKKLFGKAKETAVLPPPVGQKELQASLELEQRRCVKLQEQVERLRKENNKLSHDALPKKTTTLTQSFSFSKTPSTPLKTHFMSNLTQSPASQQSPTTLLTPRVHPTRKSQKTPTKQRMHHKIPHRFVTGLNTQPTKCGVCLGGVTFVKQASKCQECRMVCHPKCAPSAIATCGFPSDYVQHLTHITSKMATETKRQACDGDQESIMEGWIKIPRCNKPGWEKKWARMEGTELLIFHDPTSKKHIDLFDLSSTDDADVTIHSAVTAAEMSNTAGTDLPYIMRLEKVPRTTCWPERHLYVMALSFPEKQKWVATFEAAISHCAKQNRHAPSRLQMSTVVRLEGDQKLEMNCSVTLNDKLLLGAEEGLYWCDTADPTPGKVTSLDSCGSVTQIMSLTSIDSLVMIIGQDRRVAVVTASDVDRRIRGEITTLPSRVLNEIAGCTVFDAAEWRQTVYLCVGMATTVCIMAYNTNLKTFCLREELDICEPCSCVAIADNYAIVGSNKFYRVDLEHPNAVEFIDHHDNSLAFAAFGAAIHQSFPLAVVNVTSCTHLKEFLLCFHEFGVYVTADGRRSRPGDLKWSGVPLHFTYHEPYLYVTYFTSIQTSYIPTDSQLKGAQQHRKVSCPRFLGHSPRRGVAYFASNNLNSTEIALVHADTTAGSLGSITSLDSLVSFDKENRESVNEIPRRGHIRKSDSGCVNSDARTPPPSPPRKRERH